MNCKIESIVYCTSWCFHFLCSKSLNQSPLILNPSFRTVRIMDWENDHLSGKTMKKKRSVVEAITISTIACDQITPVEKEDEESSNPSEPIIDVSVCPTNDFTEFDATILIHRDSVPVPWLIPLCCYVKEMDWGFIYVPITCYCKCLIHGEDDRGICS